MRTTTTITTTGIIASPTIDFCERPWLSCVGAADSDEVVGSLLGGIVYPAIVNCCDSEIVACCIRSAADVEGGDDVKGEFAACWICTTALAPTSAVMCDAPRRLFCISLSPKPIVAASHLSFYATNSQSPLGRIHR